MLCKLLRDATSKNYDKDPSHKLDQKRNKLSSFMLFIAVASRMLLGKLSRILVAIAYQGVLHTEQGPNLVNSKRESYN
jgi:hypothetical protein